MRDESGVLISKGLKYPNAIGGFKQRSDIVRFTLTPLAPPRGQTGRDRDEKKAGPQWGLVRQNCGPRAFCYPQFHPVDILW